MFAPREAIPAFRHTQRVISAPEEFSDVVTGARLVADFLHRNSMPTRIEQFQTSDWALDFQEAHINARVFATLPPGWASLGLMRSPASSSWHGIEARQGVLLCNPPGEPIDGCITPGFECLAVNVPPALWEQCRELAGVERSTFGGFAVLHLPPPLYARIERRLHTIRHHLRRNSVTPCHYPFAAREAAKFTLQMATVAWELSTTAAPPRDSSRNRARLARRAETWMRERLPETVRVPDLCLDLRVSRRELEYAFQAAFGISPQNFIHKLRLNAIRRALLRADPSHDTITRIACEHGVTHLGRFAADYHSLFGEKPGATLQR